MLLESIYTAANFSHHISLEIDRFVESSNDLDATSWEVNRIINFFEKKSSIQILQNLPDERNLRLVSLITIQSVSQNDDDPTFLFEVYNRSNKRLFSGLLVVKNEQVMEAEAKKLMTLLEPMMVALQKPKDCPSNPSDTQSEEALPSDPEEVTAEAVSSNDDLAPNAEESCSDEDKDESVDGDAESASKD